MLQKEFDRYRNLHTTDPTFDIYEPNYIMKHFQGDLIYENELKIYKDNPIARRQAIQFMMEMYDITETHITPDMILEG